MSRRSVGTTQVGKKNEDRLRKAARAFGIARAGVKFPKQVALLAERLGLREKTLWRSLMNPTAAAVRIVNAALAKAEEAAKASAKQPAADPKAEAPAKTTRSRRSRRRRTRRAPTSVAATASLAAENGGVTPPAPPAEAAAPSSNEDGPRPLADLIRELMGTDNEVRLTQPEGFAVTLECPIGPVTFAPLVVDPSQGTVVLRVIFPCLDPEHAPIAQSWKIARGGIVVETTFRLEILR